MYFTPGWGAVLALAGTLTTATVAIASLRMTRDHFTQTLRQADSKFRAEQAQQLEEQQRQSIARVLALAHVWRQACRTLAVAFNEEENEPLSDNSDSNAASISLSLAAADLYRAMVEAELIYTDAEVRKRVIELVSVIGTVKYYISEHMGNGGTKGDVALGLYEREGTLAGMCEELHKSARKAFGKDTDDVPFPMGVGLDF